MHFPNILCWRALFTLTFGLCAHAVTIDMEGLPNTGLDTSHWCAARHAALGAYR
jgi:hypothetical protein